MPRLAAVVLSLINVGHWVEDGPPRTRRAVTPAELRDLAGSHIATSGDS